jgi:hypothetical protein
VVGALLLRATPFAIWIGLALAVAGVVAILFSSSITLTASKRTGQLHYLKKRIVAPQLASYVITNVFRIETRKQWRLQDVPGSNNQNGPARQQPEPPDHVLHHVGRVGQSDVRPGIAKRDGGAISQRAV